MSHSNISSLEKFAHRFVAEIPRSPTGRYASVILLRETKSYAIFTTEGGQQQDTERTQAGLRQSQPVDRLVMFKRKQVAPERRTGKALARQYGVFPYAITTKDGSVTGVVYGEAAIAEAKKSAEGKKDVKVVPRDDCFLTAGLCTHCPDCLTYGYAAIEGEGARKARVMTDSCFSIRPYPLIQKDIKFNVIDEQAQTSGTITEYDYTMPEVFLPSVVTTVDLTLDEFVYVLGNVLRTTRYGKESSRQGFIRNHVLALAFSDVELFANLELTQAFYDAFTQPEKEADKMDLANGFLTRQDFERHASAIISNLTKHLFGRLELIQDEALKTILAELESLHQDENRLRDFLRGLNDQSASFVV
ncbi:MAG TPA: type I-D CRISPR-associated protein Cas7/Csc2 [Pyrinomonadaceae bacterium]|nr:type I-D CRISPR-associated protein Cas7/Csc2 [Pyrinomonadaceae bacterium]